MAIPLLPAWAGLDPVAKRERLLAAAAERFAVDGLEASMPAIASAAGAGVGSLYRQFADKDELVAAIVLRRLAEVGEQLAGIGESEDAWADFAEMVWSVVDGAHGCDDVMTEALAAMSSREDVAGSRALLHASIERIMGRARAQGTLRADAGLADAKLLWAAVRDADRREAGGGRRIATLMIDGLRTR